VVFEGATKLPTNTAQTLYVAIRHWCRLLTACGGCSPMPTGESTSMTTTSGGTMTGMSTIPRCDRTCVTTRGDLA
jgi:hypothetical protein